MKTLPWFRMYHEARNDKKLATLDDHEFRVWFNLLSLASEQHPRGVIPQMSYRVLAIEVSAGDIEILNETITKLEALDVLANDGDVLWFIHFEERNHDKPSDMPEQVSERVKRHRANKKEALQNDVTPMKRDVTPSNAQEEKREDKTREQRPPLPPNGTPPPSLYIETLNGALPKLEKLFQQIDQDLFTPSWLHGVLVEAERAVGPLSRDQLGRGLNVAMKEMGRRMASEKPPTSPRPYARKLIVDYLTEQREGNHAT